MNLRKEWYEQELIKSEEAVYGFCTGKLPPGYIY